MIQYQVKYITHNDRIAVCYLYADNFEEVTASANILQGCKEVISIHPWDKKCAYLFSSFHMADIHAAKFEGTVEEVVEG